MIRISTHPPFFAGTYMDRRFTMIVIGFFPQQQNAILVSANQGSGAVSGRLQDVPR